MRAPTRLSLIPEVMIVLTLLVIPQTARAGLFDDAVSGEAEETDLAEEGEGEESVSRKGTSDGGLRLSAGGLNFELNGYVRADLWAGKVDGLEEGEIKTGYAETDLQLRIRKGNYGDAFTELRLMAGYRDNEPVVDFDLREAYVNVYAGPVDIRLGHQIIVWGRADAFNPTDNLTPKDMTVRSPSEDDRRQANLALRMHLNFNPIRIEGVWLPIYIASTQPAFSISGPIGFDSPRYPVPYLSNGAGAGRFHVETAAVELSFSYLYGHSTLPGLVLSEVDPAADSAILVARKAYRQHVAGFDFSTTVKDWFGLRGEAAYKHPVDYDSLMEAPNPDLQVVLGVDKEFLGQLSFILQYYGKYVFDWKKEKGSDLIGGSFDPQSYARQTIQMQRFPEAAVKELLSQAALDELAAKNQLISSQTEQWQHMATLRVEWKTLQETLKMEVLGSFNASTLEGLVRPKISYDIADALTVAAGGEVYLGPDDTLYGMLQDSYSAGFAEIKASF